MRVFTSNEIMICVEGSLSPNIWMDVNMTKDDFMMKSSSRTSLKFAQATYEPLRDWDKVKSILGLTFQTIGKDSLHDQKISYINNTLESTFY